MTAVDTELAEPPASPVRATRRAPATSRSCGSTRSASWSAPGPSAATSACSASPTATSCSSPGADANEIFFRAPDEDLDQAEAYPFMTPIFGEGVVFDADRPSERRKALHNQALRDKFMRGHAETIAAEVDRMVAQWAGRRRDRPARLVRRADDLHVVGLPHRRSASASSSTAASPHLYHDLERGTDAIAYVDPYADIESFRARDAARVGLVELVQGIMDGRAGEPPPEKDDRDLLDVLMSIKDEDGSLHFSADIITGMFISMMFAGHHTTSGTAAWTLIELLRDPDVPGRGRRGARRARGRRRRGQLPGAAGDAEAGGRDQGGAAAAPAAHHPAARGQGARRGRRLHDPAGDDGGGQSPSVSNRDPAGLRRRRRRSTPAATSSPARTTSPTRGAGSRSAPAATAASAPPSP